MSVPYQCESRARDHSDKNSILVPVRPIPIFLTLQRSISASEKSWILLHYQNQEAMFPRVRCKLSVFKWSVAVLIYRLRIDMEFRICKSGHEVSKITDQFEVQCLECRKEDSV
jgi:hypothetical protein